MRILVTGAGGFIGSHLIDRLAARGDEICAFIRPGRVVAPHLTKAKAVESVDLARPEAVARAVSRLKPGAIVHLAAQSLPAVSWERPWETLHDNIAGALNILDAARDQRFTGPILLAGSSSEYAAQSNSTLPIAEDHPIGASSPYSVSKIAIDQLARLYHQRHGLAIVRFRPFFWIGTRKTGDFCSDMARKIVRAEAAGESRIAVGNLEAVRDLLDVRDGIDAILLLLERGQPGEAYNVCSGIGLRMGDVLKRMLEMSPAGIRSDTDPALLRPLDETVRIGDPRKLMALGWRPQRAIAETLREILQYWRDRGD